ncbi:MAG: signal peptidase I [Candidatus Aenigmarchaeota archaeon]|nr:signal peptidase I [Candidatus Aenigmarchaeota archaeon]
MDTKKEILDNVVSVLLGILFAFLFYNALGFALGTQTPLVTVVSCSMYPELDVGDLLLLKGIKDISELKTGDDGDILVYYQENLNKLIVHRVWEIENNTVITWGDNNYEKDTWVTDFEEIKGKKILKLPYIGYPRIILFNLARGTKMNKCNQLYDHRFIEEK